MYSYLRLLLTLDSLKELLLNPNIYIYLDERYVVLRFHLAKHFPLANWPVLTCFTSDVILKQLINNWLISALIHDIRIRVSLCECVFKWILIGQFTRSGSQKKRCSQILFRSYLQKHLGTMSICKYNCIQN